MKTITRITLAGMAVFFLIGAAAVAYLNHMDTAAAMYATRADAEAARLFERGWLPAFIPLSATEIHVSSDLDLNTCEGSFHFHPSEAATFTGRLTKLDRISSRSCFSEPEAACYNYSDGEYVWVFRISLGKGYCDYTMGPASPLGT